MSPKNLIIIDGVGALLSAFMLGFVLVNVQQEIGMPLDALYHLAFFPCLFMMYDFVCYLGIKKDLSPFLKIIAVANLAYCALSIAYLIYHFRLLTILGLSYFIAEVIVVAMLAFYEWRVANRL